MEKSDKCMGVSQLMEGTCPDCLPRSTPMEAGLSYYNYLIAMKTKYRNGLIAAPDVMTIPSFQH